MFGEMVNKWGRAMFYFSCNYSCTLLFGEKFISEFKEPLYFSMLES